MSTQMPVNYFIEVLDYKNMAEKEAVGLMTLFEKALKELMLTPVHWAKVNTAKLVAMHDATLNGFELEVIRSDAIDKNGDEKIENSCFWRGHFIRGDQRMTIEGTTGSL